MATTPSISNISITRTNGFNGKSVSKITNHTLSFTVNGDSHMAYTCTVMVDTAKYIRTVNGGINASIDIGSFDSGSDDVVNKRIDISVIGSNVPMVATYTTLTIYKYSPPDVVASVARNENEQPVLTFILTYQATVAGASNTISLFWARCNVDGELYETDLKGKTSPQVLVGTYDLAKVYQFTIAIKDSVRPSAIIKRVILPSSIPVMDIGADGKTVTFFGTSPSSADKNTLRIGDVASFGEDVVLGDISNSYTVVNSNGITVHDKNTVVGDETDVIATIGIGNAVNASGSNVTGPFYTLGVRNYDENSKNGLYSTAEGWLNTASGYASHAEGNHCVASGHTSHVGGMDSSASGIASFAHGYNVRARSPRQAVFGVNNIDDDAGKYSLIVGNGGDDSGASNAFAVRSNGGMWAPTKVLWTGADYMNGGQTARLSEKISEQAFGIVMVWAYYNRTSNQVQWYSAHQNFISKWNVENHNGMTSVCTDPYRLLNKYFQVYDDRIVGNNVNGTTGTDNGIHYDNRNYVLVAIIGV